MAVEESHQQHVNQGESQDSQPDTGEHGQAGKLLGYANGEGIAHACGEAAADGQQTHADAGQGVPAQVDGQRYHDGNQGDAFLKGADCGTDSHEQQGNDSHQPIADAAETGCSLGQHVFHQAAAIQTVENAADDQQKGDDGNQRAASGSTQHQNGGQDPFPEGDTALGVGEACGGVDDQISVFIGDAGEDAAGDEERQQVGCCHQGENHHDGGYEGPDADAQALVFGLFHWD